MADAAGANGAAASRKRSPGAPDLGETGGSGPALGGLPPAKRFHMHPHKKFHMLHQQSSAGSDVGSATFAVETAAPEAEPQVDVGGGPGDALAEHVAETPEFGLPPESEAFVITFQKQAIWRRMLEYKRGLQRSDARIAHLEKRHGDLVASAAALQASVDGLCERAGQLERDTATSTRLVPSFTSGDGSATESVRTQLERASKALEAISSSLTRHADAGSLESRHAALADKVAELRGQLETSEAQTARFREELAAVRGQLEASERRLERLHMQNQQLQLARAEESGSEDVAMTGEIVEADAKPAVVAAAENLPVEPEAPFHNDATLQKLERELAQAARQQQQLQELAAARLVELERLTSDKISLSQRLHELETARVAPLNDARVTDSPLYSELYERCKFFEAEAAKLRQLATTRAALLAKLEGQRQKAIDDSLETHAAQTATFKSELAKTEADLNRMRGQRDQLQNALAQLKAREEHEMAQTGEFKALAGIRKARADALEAESGRLRRLLAASGGSAAIVACITAQNAALAARTEALELREAAAGAPLPPLPDLSELDAAVAAAESNPPLKEADASAQVAALQQRCAVLEETMDPVLGELERLNGALEDAETRLDSKVLALAAKEDQIMRLVGEKTRLAQKVQLYHRQATTASNTTLAKQRQMDKVAEHARKLDERAQLLAKQVEAAEAELALVKVASDAHDKRAADAAAQTGEATARAQRLQAAVAELEARQRDQTAQLEHAVFQRNRAVEDARELRVQRQAAADDADRLRQQTAELEQRLRDQSAGANGLSLGDSAESLRAQLADYKRLLKCPSCAVRFKSHCILRCMHTFCFDCLDERVKSRQRKCPTCGLPFDKVDIRQVYL